jgi:type II secretory pathway component PulF
MESLKTFVYFGRGSGGGYESGEVRARGLSSAQSLLLERGIAVEFLTEKRPPFWKRDWNFGKNRTPLPRTLLAFTRQLALLLRAGISLLRALELLARHDSGTALGKILESLIREVGMGHHLHEALALHPKAFDDTYRQLVRAGEASGNLAAVLEALATFRGRAIRTRSRTISALIYPLTVLAVALVALLFLSARVIPKFQLLFRDGGNAPDLPALTRHVTAGCETLRSHFTSLLLFLLISLSLCYFHGRTERGRRRFSSLALKIPLTGRILEKQNLVLFLRTLGLVLGGGVPFAEGLRLACAAVPNAFLRNYLESIAARAREGVPLGELFAESPHVPAAVQGLVAVGEASGSLAPMALHAADILEEELADALERLSALLRPLVVLLLAGVVGTVAAAMFLPLTQLLQFQSL